jgi:2-iminobutanoate/2-iminopropanoate deaminase
MTRKAVSAPGASAIGPYSHAVWAGKRLYLSGQTPLDPETGELAQGDVGAQTEQCFRNVLAVLQAAGLGANDVVKVNVYLTDMADFSAMNAVYATVFEQPYPARTTVAVAGLPRGARIEIEMIARRPAQKAKKGEERPCLDNGSRDVRVCGGPAFCCPGPAGRGPNLKVFFFPCSNY